MITWRNVHAGDTVAGRDGRHWLVVERGELVSWASGGQTVTFTLGPGPNVIRVGMRLDDPAPLVARGPGLAEDAAAVQTMIDGGIPVEVISEVTAPVAPAEVKRDRWGRYMLTDPTTGQERAWTRVTTVASAISDTHNLTQWKMRQVLRGAARRADLIAAAQAADPEADKGLLNKLCSQAMDVVASSAGANMGTALHSLTAAIDRGHPLPEGLSPAVLADLDAYRGCLRDHGLHVSHVERIVCLPQYGVAGTLDRIVSQPSGHAHAAPLTILDVKTGKDLSYGWLEIATQIAAYARAPYVMGPDGDWEAMPPVDQARALVVHLPAGTATATLYAVDIMKGWAAFQLAMSVRQARSDGRSLGWLVDNNPAGAFLLRVQRAASQDELAALWEEGQRRGLWTEEVNAAAAQRFDQIMMTDPTDADI